MQNLHSYVSLPEGMTELSKHQLVSEFNWCVFDDAGLVVFLFSSSDTFWGSKPVWCVNVLLNGPVVTSILGDTCPGWFLQPWHLRKAMRDKSSMNHGIWMNYNDCKSTVPIAVIFRYFQVSESLYSGIQPNGSNGNSKHRRITYNIIQLQYKGSK